MEGTMVNNPNNDAWALVDFVVAVLDDNHGISTEAYGKLLVLIGDDPGNQFESIRAEIKCTHGRWYLPIRQRRLAELKAKCDAVKEKAKERQNGK